MKLLSFGEIVWDICGDRKTLGGAPLNLAAHAALQEDDAWLLSAVGRDPLGREAMERIRELGIHSEYIDVNSPYPTGQCTVTLDADRVPSYRLSENAAYDHIPVPDALPHTFDILVFETLALRSEQNRETLRQMLCKNRFENIYTDLNIRAPFYSKEVIDFCLSHATIIKISEEELPVVTQQLSGAFLNTVDAPRWMKKNYPQARLLLITQGEKGSLCYDLQTDRIYRCEAVPTTAVSTVGAGDSYGATFLSWYFKTKDVMLSMRYASKVSAFVVSRQEAIPKDTKEFLKTACPC